MITRLAEASFRKHRCRTCDKAFLTNSHLRRHEASHTKRRQLTCPFCEKQFSRRDLACRHVKRCSPDGDKITFEPLKRGKRRTSCDTCSQRKVSCDANTPCLRCRSRGIACTYGQFERSTLSTLRIVGSGHSGSPVLGATEASSSRTVEQIPLDFLLTLTTPGSYHASTAVAVNAFESDATEGETSCLSPQSYPTDDYEGLETLLWDPEPCSLESFGYTSSEIAQQVVFDEHYPEALTAETRMSEMVHGLSAMHNLKYGHTSRIQGDFSIELAQAVFTVANLRRFVWGYFHRYYDYLPIIHKPTFDSQTVSLPLLLAIFLSGSLSFFPSDISFSAKRFFNIAETYIFEHPIFSQEAQDRSQAKDSGDDIEVLQAALMLLIIQLNNCDRTVRRRIRLQRLPCFITTVRALGLFEYKHHNIAGSADETEWGNFVYDEIRVRTAAHAFMFDSHMAVLFNLSPQVAISEMIGDLPCDKDIFEADSASKFMVQRCLRKQIAQPHSLSQLTSFLCSGSVPTASHPVKEHIRTPDLLMAICALQSIAVASKMNFLMPGAAGLITRALNRWKNLWDAVTQESEGSGVRKIGFEKHAVELWWLVQMVVKAAKSKDLNGQYMQTLPLDSTEDLHDFIRRNKL
ncbi:hypothetical protein T440DRAFT_473706 [Plenodomus tracheiphilus IPT5]|uniref:C2H2 finger domain protein n=1 Tax=Plenodomus tracheiphilus IPT5 TaxID=1408161 RepID=A0A6A7ALR6_9PLEO|nr:hypothetical protein T440DRAFT_473706 [Plenodomus tracheiphilus IPT5]